MTVQEAGRLGGKARGERLRSGEIRISGAAVGTPTPCARCGAVCTSKTAAHFHYRVCKLPKPAANSVQE